MTDYNMSILHELVFDDIIEEDVLELFNIMKKKKVLSFHKYPIIEPSTRAKKPLWMTRVYDDTKTDNRRRITAKSEQLLYNKLYEHYFESKVHTIESLYEEWIEKRWTSGLAVKTISRNQNHWNRYYRGHPLVKVAINKIDVEMIEDFFHQTILDFEMTRKELNNMKLIMKEAFRIAMVRKLTTYNPLIYININTYMCFPPNKKSDEDSIFHPDEIERLFESMNKDLKDHPEVTDIYALFLLFKLGLRIGEVVALKEADLSFEHHELHIHRMEKVLADENKNSYIGVVDYPKKKSTYGDRYLHLSGYELDLLKTVLSINKSYGYHDNGFIFCDENGRTKASEINSRLKKVCSHAGISGKSTHTIRRTVATELYDVHNDIQLVCDFLGHSHTEVTWGYVYKSDSKRKAFKQLTSDISHMDGLRSPMVAQIPKQ